jgi:hypothetical protein
VSPIIIAPGPVGMNAAHEVIPAGGGNGMPSTVSATSVRGHVARSTPSSVVLTSAPNPRRIESTSSGRGFDAA